MLNMQRIALALTIAVPFASLDDQARACDVVHVIAYQHTAGSELSVWVNDAVVFRALPGGSGGSATPRFLINGTNTVSAILDPGSAEAPKARLEVFDGCEGEFPFPVGENENVLASLALDGDNSAQTSFELTGPPETAWSTAEPADDDAGLLDAAQALIAAAKAQDVDAYVGAFKPMLADMAARGMPAEQMLASMAAGVFSEMEVVDPKPLSARAILGGRVWEVTDADGKAPLQFQGPGGEADSLEQGMYWVHDGSSWGVVRQ